MRVSENMVLRKIFGAKRDKVTGEGRRLRDGQLNDLYRSPNIIWMMKSRTMRWGGMWHVCGTGDVHIIFWWGDLMERDHLEDLCVDGRIILRLIFKRWDGKAGLLWLRKGTGGGYLGTRQ